MRLAISFLKIAKTDLKLSFDLFTKKEYPHAIYLFQQSVEKSVKSYGLLVEAIQPSDCSKKISHKSHKVFTRLITKTKEGFETYFENKALVESFFPIDKKFKEEINLTYSEVKNSQTKFQHFHEDDFFYLEESEIDEMISSIEKKEDFKIGFDEDAINKFVQKTIPEISGDDRVRIENLKKYLREEISNLEDQLYLTNVLIHLSLITFPHNQATRYPCEECGGLPEEIYNDGLPIIVKYDRLFEYFDRALFKLESMINRSP